MDWYLFLVIFATSLLTAAIAFVGLWLGWNARDRVGQALHEAYVGRVGLQETQEPSITLEDFLPQEVDEEDNEF